MDPKYIPVGTVMAYAGEVKGKEEELMKSGWLICDGRGLEKEKYPELFQNIQIAFGTPSADIFRIPDLRGFFIRAVTGPSSNDPDVNSRIALYTGGNGKNAVGSYQRYATAPPKSPFRATITNNNIVSMKLDKATDAGRSGKLDSNSDSTTGATNGTGGDLETRPKNKYVYYLIKKSRLDQNNDPVQIPIGAVIPFSGKPNQAIRQQYLRCMGQGISQVGQFDKLFKAIGYAHGKPKDKFFNLPDYQGYFLRGVDNQSVDSRRDKEADQRTAPCPNLPEGQRGNAGDQVGSVQNCSTAYPLSGSFITKLPRLPKNEGSMAMDGAVKTTLDWNSNKVTAVVSQKQGDAETRPINMSVDWYIKFS